MALGALVGEGWGGSDCWRGGEKGDESEDLVAHCDGDR